MVSDDAAFPFEITNETLNVTTFPVWTYRATVVVIVGFAVPHTGLGENAAHVPSAVAAAREVSVGWICPPSAHVFVAPIVAVPSIRGVVTDFPLLAVNIVVSIAWVCEVVDTAFVEVDVIEPGVPIVTVPDPVIVVKFIPFPDAMEYTVPLPATCHVPSSRRNFVPVLARIGHSPIVEAVATERRVSLVSTRLVRSTPLSCTCIPVPVPVITSPETKDEVNPITGLVKTDWKGRVEMAIFALVNAEPAESSIIRTSAATGTAFRVSALISPAVALWNTAVSTAYPERDDTRSRILARIVL
jgi:hypothetical protein